jgi:hypothetical protein
MKTNLTPKQKKALFNNPLLQTQEFKKKWIKIQGTEINRALIRTYGISDDGVSIQLESGEWMHWKLSETKAREVIEKINNQFLGRLSENYLKAEENRKHDDQERLKEYQKCLQKPKQPMSEAVNRMIQRQKRLRRPVNSWWMRQVMSQAPN